MVNKHQQNLDTVVQYIEENLDKPVDIARLAEITCFSKFHFHRLFRLHVGESIYAYRKRLLLERAAKQLLYTNDSITQIAFTCAYENQPSFNKAFKNQFGYTPSQVRKQHLTMQTNTNKYVHHDTPLKPEITTIEDISVICTRATGSYDHAAPIAWAKMMQYIEEKQLKHEGVRLIGISYDDPNITNPDHIRYAACLEVNAEMPHQSSLKKHTISGGKYAMFLYEGSHKDFQGTYADIFNMWLPQSGYRLCDKTCFEVYLKQNTKETTAEIYIPIA